MDLQDQTKADSLDFKKARTHKGRKIIDDMKPKAVEGPKQTLFLKGNKTSDAVIKALQNLYFLKKPNSTFLNERWEIRPFETVDKLENVCNKKDCGMFVFGCNTKKRPNSLYMGRLFDEHILDLVEFEVKKATEIDSRCDIVPDEKPCIIFQGDVFEYDSNFMRIKNLIADLFVENVQPKVVNIKEGLRHFIVITGDADSQSLHIRQYELTISTLTLINESSDFSSFAKDIGPSIDLVYRRANFANDEQYKKACKQPKVTKDKHAKNISTDSLGQKKGRVYVEKQNLGELSQKKRKALMEPRKKVKKESEANAVEEEVDVDAAGIEENDQE